MKLLAACAQRLERVDETRLYLVLLCVGTAISTAFLTIFLVDFQRNFMPIGCDTAAFQSTIVNTLHGHWFRDTAYDGPNYLGLHCIFVLLLVAPIYALFPAPETLFVLEIWGVYSAVIPLYLLAAEMTKKPLVAFLIAFIGLASPIMLHMAAGPFHPETWILASVLWACWFYRRNWLFAFVVALVFGLGCGEQAALIFIPLGLAWLLHEDGMARRKLFAMIAIGSGIAWLIITVGIITPLMHQSGQINLVAHNYPNWKAVSLPGLAWATLSDPIRALLYFTSPGRWWHLFTIIGPIFLFAFVSWRAAILLAPLPLYLLMKGQEFGLYFHSYYYQFAWLAGFTGLMIVVVRSRSGRGTFLLLGSLLFLNIIMVFPLAALYFVTPPRERQLNIILHHVFAEIPRTAGVYGPHRFSVDLSNRDNFVMGDLAQPDLDFDALIDRQDPPTSVHSEDIDWIVCDVQNDQGGPRDAGLDTDKSNQRLANLKRLEESGHWRIYWSREDVVILKRVR